MANIGTFDLRKLNVIFGISKITGYAEGDSITIAEKNPAFNTEIGADQHTDRIRNRSNHLIITIRLAQTTKTNQVLSALHSADRLASAPLPIVINDKNGTTLISSLSAWIVGFPEIKYGNESKPREWTIHTSGDYVVNVGGN